MVLGFKNSNTLMKLRIGSQDGNGSRKNEEVRNQASASPRPPPDPKASKLAKKILQDLKGENVVTGATASRDVEITVHDILDIMNVLSYGPNGGSYIEALQRAMGHEDSVIFGACARRYLRERRIVERINILDAIFDQHVIQWPPEHITFSVDRDYIAALLTLNTNETRRKYLATKVNLWQSYGVEYQTTMTIHVTKKTAVEVARLLSPPFTNKHASDLGFISLMFENKDHLEWEGLQYTIVNSHVQRRLAEHKKLDCTGASTDAISRFLIFVFQSRTRWCKQIRDRMVLMSFLDTYIAEGSQKCSMYQFLFFAERILFEAYIKFDFLFEVMARMLSATDARCQFCLESAAYFLLLSIDGPRLKRFKVKTRGDGLNSLIAKAAALFATRGTVGLPRGIPDGSRVWEHIIDTRTTLSEEQLQLLEPLLNPADMPPPPVGNLSESADVAIDPPAYEKSAEDTLI